MKKFALALLGVFTLLVFTLLYAEQNPVPPAHDPAPVPPAQSDVRPQPEPPAPPQPPEPLAWLVGVEDRHPYNQELQHYLPEQCRTRDHTLYLTAEQTEDGYISGKAESEFAFRYGEFSFRIRTMRGAGLFPALWMLPAHGSAYPEVDLYELIGSRPHEIFGVLHYQEGGRHYFRHKFPQSSGPDAIVLDFSWTPDKLVWTVDGQEFYSVDKDVPREPMYFIANLAVGGSWPGAPDRSTPFPATFAVDVLKFEPIETFTR